MSTLNKGIEMLHLKCPQCGVHFNREKKVVTQTLRRGRKGVCCSKSCSNRLRHWKREPDFSGNIVCEFRKY